VFRLRKAQYLICTVYSVDIVHTESSAPHTVHSFVQFLEKMAKKFDGVVLLGVVKVREARVDYSYERVGCDNGKLPTPQLLQKGAPSLRNLGLNSYAFGGGGAGNTISTSTQKEIQERTGKTERVG